MLANYKLLVLAIPRLVSFVSTVSRDGMPNLAPFSYFQVVDHDPPIVVIAFSARPDRPQDTQRNLKETGVCVINLLSAHFVEAANATSFDVPYGTSEWALSGLTPRDATTMAPQRVQEAVFAMEGKLLEMKSLDYHGLAAQGKPAGALAIIEVTNFWVRSDALDAAGENVFEKCAVEEKDVAYSRGKLRNHDRFPSPNPLLVKHPGIADSAMVGLKWTYNQLAKYHVAAGRAVATLNPVIQDVLTACPGSTIFGLGGDSVEIQVAEDLTAKMPLEADDVQLRQEQAVFGLLERQTACAFIVPCWFRGTGLSFLALLPHGTLHDRISWLYRPRPVVSWMWQLASAVACLEAIGYAHGDLSPQNILLDDRDQLRLIDLGYALPVGRDVEVGYEPYVRQRRVKWGGLFGVAGPITKQSALGSVFWYMVRGTQVYAELDGAERVDRLLDAQFPETDPADPVDRIIARCWHGQYALIAALVADISTLPGWDAPAEADQKGQGEEREAKEKICADYYDQICALSSRRAALSF